MLSFTGEYLKLAAMNIPSTYSSEKILKRNCLKYPRLFSIPSNDGSLENNDCLAGSFSIYQPLYI